MTKPLPTVFFGHGNPVNALWFDAIGLALRHGFPRVIVLPRGWVSRCTG